MDSPSNVSTVDLTLSTSDVQTSSTSDAQTSSSNNDKMSCTVKAKIGRSGLEQYFVDFKEYIFLIVKHHKYFRKKCVLILLMKLMKRLCSF